MHYFTDMHGKLAPKCYLKGVNSKFPCSCGDIKWYIVRVLLQSSTALLKLMLTILETIFNMNIARNMYLSGLTGRNRSMKKMLK